MKKTIVITGVTSGIGKALMTHFVQKGQYVIGISRNGERLNLLADYLESKNLKGNYQLITCDFSSLKETQKTAYALEKDYPEGIDVLINNAAIVPQKKVITEDGFELQYQVNHLAVVLMSHLLMDSIAKKNGRIITTGSDAHKWARFKAEDLQTLKRYSAFRAYARTKLYNLMFTLYCQKAYTVKPIHHYNVHPGRVKTEIGTKETSKLYAAFWRWFTKKGFLPEETIPSYDRLVFETPPPSDTYYFQAKPQTMSSCALDVDKQNILIKQTMKELSQYIKKTPSR